MALQDRLNEEAVLRHLAFGKAWKDFDTNFPTFSCEPRNVHLGLATDGFNPFDNMNLSYSMWLVVLTMYNLPPLAMYERFVFHVETINSESLSPW